MILIIEGLIGDSSLWLVLFCAVYVLFCAVYVLFCAQEYGQEIRLYNGRLMYGEFKLRYYSRD